MHNFSKQFINLLKEKNIYNYPIVHYYNVLSYLSYFENFEENDYIIYHDDNTFEYTPQFYSFIKSLFDAKLVEEVQNMTNFLKSYEQDNAYQIWVNEMNEFLSNDELICKANLSFIKKAFFTLIRMEQILPGSWGIDVEIGNWHKLLLQLDRIFFEIFSSERLNMN